VAAVGFCEQAALFVLSMYGMSSRVSQYFAENPPQF